MFSPQLTLYLVCWKYTYVRRTTESEWIAFTMLRYPCHRPQPLIFLEALHSWGLLRGPCSWTAAARAYEGSFFFRIRFPKVPFLYFCQNAHLYFLYNSDIISFTRWVYLRWLRDYFAGYCRIKCKCLICLLSKYIFSQILRHSWKCWLPILSDELGTPLWNSLTFLAPNSKLQPQNPKL